MRDKKISSFIYIFLSVVFLEIVIKKLIFNRFFSEIGSVLLFSLPFIFFITLISRIFSEKTNRKVLIGLITIIIFWFELQFIFYKLFNLPFSFATLSLIDQAIDFASIAVNAILENIIGFLLLLVPLIILLLLKKHLSFKKYENKQSYTMLLVCIITYFFSLALVIPSRNRTDSLGNLYYNVNNQSKILNTFGILTGTKIDLKRFLTNFEEVIVIEDNAYEYETPLPKELGFNQILNLSEIIENEKDHNLVSMHEYFASIEATNKNKYTGMYKNKNLIFILAEGFNSIAISEELTPTLYKMTNSSFVFENFYSPVFLSTTGGEFQATTGLIPTMNILNSYTKTQPVMSYGLGNVFNELGYNAQGYHNWTYTYYKRNVSMASLGFDNYIGCNNGMEKLINCAWLPSDIEMMEQTVPLYAEQTPFVTYYVTVSGHAPYVLNNGNSIALKNKDLVANLDYNSSIKAYLATQIELDRALEKMLTILEETGVLDDTVIALVGDHYPYTLSLEDINTLSNYNKDSIIEVNRSNFILWSNDTEKEVITKVGSQIDVLPTLLNLFGIEYDSRLIVGKDILSDAQGLAIFSNRSWVSDSGHYYAAKNQFVLKEGQEVDEGYVEAINRRVANSFAISEKIINNKYYEKVIEALKEE